MKRNLKILYLDHSSDFSGGQLSLIALLRLLNRDKFRPVAGISTSAHLMKEELKSIQVPIVELPFGEVKWYRPMRILRLLRTIKKTIEIHDIDIVHSNTFLIGAIMAAFKFFVKRPLIFRARLAIEFHGHGLIDRIIYRSSDLILANSHYVKSTFIQRFGDNKKIATVYNPLIADPIRYEAAPPGVFTFAIIGRIEPIKRHMDLVAAVDLLSRKGLSFSIWILGAPSVSDKGAYYEKVKREIACRKLEHIFRWNGFIKDPMKLALSFNAVISCTIGEALSRSIFECQLHGIPVLAARSGGNLELIRHGETGYFFEAGNPQHLADQMEFLINCPKSHLNSVASMARNEVKETFEENNTVRKEESYYIKLAKRTLE